jgi:hypothetical protein
MDFMDISSLGVAYRYIVKIDQKFRHQNKQEFGSINPQQPKYGKYGPNNQPSENQSKLEEKKGNGSPSPGTQHNGDHCFLRRED